MTDQPERVPRESYDAAVRWALALYKSWQVMEGQWVAAQKRAVEAEAERDALKATLAALDPPEAP